MISTIHRNLFFCRVENRSGITRACACVCTRDKEGERQRTGIRDENRECVMS